jgi:MraZ protein
MTPFLGQHQNRLDAKGRVSVPSAYRAALKHLTGSSEMVLRPSFTHACIEAWPTSRFNELEKSLNALDVFSAEYEDLSTAIYANAYPVEADKDGRILLPEFLMKHAGLSDAVTFMGAGQTFQIWEPAAAAARAVDAQVKSKERQQTRQAGAASAVIIGQAAGA